MRPLAVGIVVVAAVATVGDFVWFELGVRHQATVGALHGAVLLGTVGLVLGWLNGRMLAGLAGGVAAGVGGAAAYYGLASFGSRGMNFPAMVAAWAAVWMVLAAYDGRVLRRDAPRAWLEIFARGIVAAGVGAIAFYFVLDVVWGRPPAEGRNYALQFAAWALAWAPGLLAIGTQRPSRS
jgi:hypothetical protein